MGQNNYPNIFQNNHQNIGYYFLPMHINIKNNQPTSVTFITLFVLSITIWNIFRIISTVKNWQVLISYGGNPFYILGSGIIWVISGLFLFFSIFTRNSYSRLFANLTGCAYFGWYWYDRILVQLFPAPNSVFSIFFSGTLLTIFLITINIPASKAFFLKE